MNITQKNITNFILIIISFLVIIGIFSVYAGEFHIKKTGQENEKEILTLGNLNENQYIVSDKLRFIEPVVGDIFSLSSSVLVESKVTGDINALSQILLINSLVDGDVRAVANKINISKNILGEVLSLAESFTIDESAVVSREVNIAASNAYILGKVNGDLNINSDNGIIKGTIIGNVIADGNLYIDKDAIVNGKIIYKGEKREDLVIEDGAYIGEIIYQPKDEDNKVPFYFEIYFIISTLIIVLFITFLSYMCFTYGRMPHFINCWKSILVNFATGLGFLILVPIISFLLILIPGLFYISFVLMSLYFTMILLGTIFTPVLLSLIIERIRGKEYSLTRISTIISGIILFLFAVFLHWVFISIFTISSLVAIGGVILFTIKRFSK